MPGAEDNLKQLSKSCNRGKMCQLNKKNTLAYFPVDHFSLPSVCWSDLASLSGSGARSILSLQSLSQQLVAPIWASSACRKDINSEMLSLSFSWVSYCHDPRLSQVRHGPDLGRVTAALATPDTHGSDFLGRNFQNCTGAGKDMTRIRHLHLKQHKELSR